MRRFLRFLPVFFATAALAGTETRVAVLANADDPDSVALAKHYLAARAIPEANLITLSLPPDEEIDWKTFVGRIRNPLLSELTRRGLLTGETEKNPDAEGRLRFITHAKRFDHLVLCKGVPLKIRNDATLPGIAAPDLPPQFRVNQCAVDSELALLPRAGTPTAGLIPNPRHNILNPPAALTLDTLMVARLDGPTYADAERLVDNAIEAEKNGAHGRAYIDLGGPHKSGEEKLAAAGQICQSIFLDTEIEKTSALFAPGCRFDAPLFYFGWYAESVAGAFESPSFRFPPGAVAMHIHSYSASTLRSVKTGWAGPFVARGVTLTVGNVYEPYLEFTHNPSLLMNGLVTGMCAGEAAAYATPALSWQTIVVGDPLYRPFLHTVDLEIADFETRADPAQAYFFLKLAAALDSQGKNTEADTLLSRVGPRLPVLALERGRLERAIKAGKKSTFKADNLAPIPEDPGLVYSTAVKLASVGLSGEALKLLANQHALGVRFDQRAADFARAHAAPDLARRLAPPPPPQQRAQAKRPQ